ncbi:MAG: replication-relaxation family protein [Dissulfurispiraceae bacterium]
MSGDDVSIIRLRDESIFYEGIAGGCTFIHLFKKFGPFFADSEHAMRQRLAQLVRGQYLESGHYVDNTNGHQHVLYVLGTAGIEHMCIDKCMREEIRTLLPSQHTPRHELVVTDLVRKLRKESVQMKYLLSYYDDSACKSLKTTLGLQSPKPDLLVDIRLPDEFIRYRTLFEVHMGSVSIKEVIDRACRQVFPAIYLINTKENMMALWTSMQDYPKLAGMVYFILICDFFTEPGGLFGSNYMAWDGRVVSLYM